MGDELEVNPIVDDPEVEEEEKEVEEDDKDTDEDKESKEDEEKEEEQLTRVELKELTGKFPTLFKDFPTLKHAFFREQQFTEIFPTVEEAKKAQEAQAAYEEISAAVIDGDAHKFVKELGSESKDSIKDFATNFLPALKEENKDVYLDVITPVVAQFIKNVYSHGLSEKDENISNAAKIVHKVLFGGAYEDVGKDSPIMTREKSKDEEKLEQDKKNYLNGKYAELYKNVTDTCYSALDQEIEKGLADLTKTKPGLKKILARDIKKTVLETMESDPNYLTRMQALWKRESRNSFSGTHKGSLHATFLGKAKAVLPRIRAEARKEALGKEDVSGNGKEPTRIDGGKRSSGHGKKMTPERVKAEGLTTKGIFDAD